MQNCRKCGFKKWLKPRSKNNRWVDVEYEGNKYRLRQWRCGARGCGHLQAEEPPPAKEEPRILYFDIERAPGEAYYYNRRTDYIPANFLKTEPFIICWAASWVGSDKIVSECVTSKEARHRNDKRIMKILWDMLDSADLVVGHNVNSFDIRHVNNRFLQWGMSAPSTYKTVDTLKLIRRYAPFESNGLDYIAPRMGGKPKQDIFFDDWRRIVETGDQRTLNKARKYCRGDVSEGITVFLRLREWVESGGGVVFK